LPVTLNLVHLYPRLLNLYGDRGNIITLVRRCAWRGITMDVHEVGLAEPLPDLDIDFVFMGGDQDREQAVVVDDLRRNHAGDFTRMVAAEIPVLAVCGSYQLLQRFYRPAEGPDLPGLGIFDAYTVHPGHDTARCVGNIVAEWNGMTLVGFENHGGRTFLQGETRPLAHVLKGFGNNGQDGFEGARVANVFGTYIHGALLPKNPRFADYLLELALHHRYPDAVLPPLDDALEQRAHEIAVVRTRWRARSSLLECPGRRAGACARE
jgi:CobQ-like glutamine amidotransferase family enzyme